MRILAFTYAATINGGANRSFLMVLEWLKTKYQHDITVVVPSNGPLCECLDKLSIKWIEHKSWTVGAVPISSIKNFFRTLKYDRNLIFDYFSSASLITELKKSQFDVVYINDNATFIGALFAHKLDLPYVWHFRSDCDAKAIFVPGAAKLLKDSSSVIAISKGMMDQYGKHRVLTKTNMKLVFNAIPVDEAIGCSSQDRKNGLQILLCGRICEDKCQMDAVKAIQYIKEVYQIQDVFLHIVGKMEGAYYEQIKCYIQKNGLTSQVFFDGFVNDMPRFRMNMNCELICSKREPFGRVTLEGMRSGLIVIGANTGGTPEIINDGETGFLYEQGKIDDLVSKIMFVYNTPRDANKVAQKAYSFSQIHFTPLTTVEMINRELTESVECNKNCKRNNR